MAADWRESLEMRCEGWKPLLQLPHHRLLRAPEELRWKDESLHIPSGNHACHFPKSNIKGTQTGRENPCGAYSLKLGASGTLNKALECSKSRFSDLRNGRTKIVMRNQ